MYPQLSLRALTSIKDDLLHLVVCRARRVDKVVDLVAVYLPSVDLLDVDSLAVDLVVVGLSAVDLVLVDSLVLLVIDS